MRGFVNSHELEGDRETFTSPEVTRAWLVEHDLLETRAVLRENDVVRLRAVREALRALLLANAGHDLDPGALLLLNEEAGRATLAVRFSPDGSAVLTSAGSGADGAVARVLAIVHVATVDGTWPRLKACLNEECLWAFYDHSKNRSGRWCTMDVCGNVMKARAYRLRTKGPHGD